MEILAGLLISALLIILFFAYFIPFPFNRTKKDKINRADRH